MTEWDKFIREQDYFKFLLAEPNAQKLLRAIGKQALTSKTDCLAYSRISERDFNFFIEKLRQFSLIEMFPGVDWENHYRLTSQGQQALQQLNKT